jgi:hypothetical protein
MTTKIPAELSSTPSIVDNGDATAITIDSSEQIGIGTTAPNDYDNNSAGISSNLVVKDSGHSGIIVISGTSSDAAISFGDGTGTAAYRGAVAYVNSADALYFKAAGANKLRLDSDGLKFGSDTAAANALDDYEEGTWTPAISTGGVTYTIQVGKYTKIGNFVSASFHIDINTNSNGSSTTFYITGLPFTASAAPLSIYYQSATLHCNLWNNSSIPDNGLIAGNTAALNLYIRSGTSVSSPTHGSLGGGNILATMNYQTDA